MDALTDFHFIRPLWLLLIPALLFASYWLSKQGQRQTGFEQWIDADLLRHITTGTATTTATHLKPIYLLLAGAWIIASIALAGPTWQQLPQPLQKSEQAMVIILDLSPSMRAEDNKPSRIVRARLKIKDLLSQRKDGLTALVVYAGEAHVVTPLTDDTKTIINLLSTLEPGLLPIPGSNIEMAMDTAKRLVTESGISYASYVLITDGIDPRAVDSIETIVDTQTNSQLFIIGVGTPEGALIPAPSSNNNDGFLRDKNGTLITAARNDTILQTVAEKTHGHYLPLQANDADIDFILNSIDRPSLQAQTADTDQQRQMDQWEEFGPTLLLLFLPLFALMFRRGWLLCCMVVIFPMTLPTPAQALSWDDLFLNKNQQAQKAFEQKDYTAAEQLFSDKDNKQWQGSAAYKNKDYQAAVDAFAKGDTATDDYNRGNALAQLQRYDDAITAYDSALEKDPTLEDAKKNKALVQKIKEQQSKEKKQQQDGENGDDKQSQENGEQNDQDKSSSENDQKQDKQQEGQQKDQQDDKKQNSDSSQQENSDKQQQDQEEKEQQASKEKNKEEKEQNVQQQASAQKEDDKNNKDDAAQDKPSVSSTSAFDKLSTEEKQELEQWIQKIPDDPSGLLREKFKYEFEKRRRLYQSGKWDLPDNNAHERY